MNVNEHLNLLAQPVAFLTGDALPNRYLTGSVDPAVMVSCLAPEPHGGAGAGGCPVARPMMRTTPLSAEGEAAARVRVPSAHFPKAQRARRGYVLRKRPFFAIIAGVALAHLSAASAAFAAESEPLPLPAALTATSAALLMVALGLGLAYLRIRRHERAAQEAVAERDRAIQAIRLGEERYRDLFNNINGGVAVLEVVEDGSDFIVEDLNAAGERITGRFREDIVGRRLAEVDFTGMGAPLLEVCREVWRSGKSVRRYLSSKAAGRGERWFECFAYKLSTGELVFVYEDITPQKRAEDENRLLATAIEYASESIFITTPEGVVEYANPAFERLSGFSSAEAIGKTPRILKSGRHSATFYAQLWATLLRGETWRGRLTNKRKNGSLYEKEVTISPVLNPAGEVEHFISISRDLTQEMELAAQLRQAQKMEAIGTLAGGIAHDFNNILSAIIGFAELALEDMPEPSVTRKCIEEVRKAGRRAAELVHQILTFSRQTEQEHQPVQIQPVLKEAMKLLRGTLPVTITIQQDIDSECGQILADPTQLHQVIVNLCTNAYHAMRERGGVLTVTYRRLDIAPGGPEPAPGLPPGDYAHLSVTDTGKGMNKATLERIFEPYFTTKPPGEGTGMGLAIVHGIVRGHQGLVTVKSAPGEGSTFDVYIPLYRHEEDAAAPEGPSLVRRARGERILFVDDEESLALLARMALERSGYRVLSCTKSLEALRRFEERPQDFDVVITDQTMPDMTGEELAERMRAIRPDIPIILCTGYSERMDERRAREAKFNGYLEKPFVDADLSRAIQQALADAQTKAP